MERGQGPLDLRISVEGSVMPTRDAREVHLRLWKVPFFWQEREVAAALQKALGAHVTHVKAVLYRDVRSSVKTRQHAAGGGGGGRPQPQQVGGKSTSGKVHCSGAALVVGSFALEGSVLVRVEGTGAAAHLRGCFRAEVSTQARSPFCTSVAPVPTLACCAYQPTEGPGPPPSTTAALLRLVAAPLLSASLLVSCICLARDGAASAAAASTRCQVVGVQATHYLVECPSAQAASVVKFLLHDSRTGHTVHTAEYTTRASGVARAGVYKPLFVPEALHAVSPQCWPAWVHHVRNECLAVTGATLSAQVAQTEAHGIPSSVLEQIQKAAELSATASTNVNKDEHVHYALMGAVACAALLDHI